MEGVVAITSCQGESSFIQTVKQKHLGEGEREKTKGGGGVQGLRTSGEGESLLILRGHRLGKVVGVVGRILSPVMNAVIIT